MMGGEEEVFGFFVARVGYLELKIGNLNLESLMNHQQTYVTSGAYPVGVKEIFCGGKLFSQKPSKIDFNLS